MALLQIGSLDLSEYCEKGDLSISRSGVYSGGFPAINGKTNKKLLGYKYQISFTIYVDGNLSTFDSHEIANKLEKEIDNKIEEIYLTVIHVNPI